MKIKHVALGRENQENIWLLILLLFAALVLAVYPLMQSGLIEHKGQDLAYHLLRIEGIKEELQLGHFPAKIHGIALGGYGYGNSLFYPDGLLYFPAVLRLLGVGLEAAYKVFVFAVTLGTMLSAYFSMKYVTKSRYAAGLFTVLLVLSQYRLSNVYVRAAVGEYTAYLFLPMLLAGIYDYFEEGFRRPWLLGGAFLGLFLTHSNTFVICALVTAVWFLCHFRRAIQDKKRLLRLFKTALMVVLLSCFFWAPFLEQIFAQRLNFHQPWATPSEWAYSPWTLLDGSYFVSIGLPLLLFIGVRLCIRPPVRRDREQMAWPDGWLLFGIGLTLMATSLFPWQWLDWSFFRFIQFPWRFYALASVFLAAAIGWYCHLAFQGKRRKQVAAAAILFICGACAVYFLRPLIQPNLWIGEDYARVASFSIGAGEWLPEHTDGDRLNHPQTVYDEQGQAIPVTKKQGTKVTFSVGGESDDYDVPLLYYAGYEAVLTQSDGGKQTYPVERSSEDHVVRVTGLKGKSGEVTVFYKGTWIQTVSLLISLGTAIFYGLFPVLKRRKEGEPKKAMV